ncbi:phosphonatase-like hydrolase [Dyadobacter psychrotolerans]|uniref:Phosphonatase-like hydrolase n=1 Tax=Dyadobacter psychrotolerans TaxID=2541721 RepID=A0A4R5DB33_9BACT|nr:phosphonatase-like hydrolase [Dyadobacter psychrotolerans]TDE09011.1 phosphonatase-like hydrolase [Dyadobacter psychrotolerans]
MIRMVIFDMAGTTVNENNVVYKTLMRAINERQFDFTLEEVLSEGAGMEKLQAIRSILASKQIADEVLANDIFKTFKKLLKTAYEDLDVTEQNNATPLFAELKKKGISVALNTGYDRQTAEGLIGKIGWQKATHYDELITASDVEKNRPNPDMILLAMKNRAIEHPDQVVKVGDSAIDIEEGQNAGCLFSIGITTGAQTREQLLSAAPDFVIDNLMQLLAIINGFEN